MRNGISRSASVFAPIGVKLILQPGGLQHLNSGGVVLEQLSAVEREPLVVFGGGVLGVQIGHGKLSEELHTVGACVGLGGDSRDSIRADSLRTMHVHVFVEMFLHGHDVCLYI